MKKSEFREVKEYTNDILREDFDKKKILVNADPKRNIQISVKSRL